MPEKLRSAGLALGIVLMVLATLLAVGPLGRPDLPLWLQAAGLFVCVAGFLAGAGFAYSSLPRASRALYVVAPLVVVLGAVFIVNYLRLSGITRIVTEYPRLKAENQLAQGRIADCQDRVRRLEALLHVRRAASLLRGEGSASGAARELRQAQADLAALGIPADKLQSLIEDLERVPSDLANRLYWLQYDLERQLDPDATAGEGAERPPGEDATRDERPQTEGSQAASP